MAVEKVTFASPQQSSLTKKRKERQMLAGSTNPEPDRRKPYPLVTHPVHAATCPPGQLPLTKPANGTRPPPPHSKQTTTLVTRTVNALLLQSACDLASHSGPPPPTGRPISLHDPHHPLLQALRKADEAYSLAVSRRRFELVPKAQMFRGHAYRAMGLWDLAYDAYVRAASHPGFAGDRSEEGLECLTRLCAEMRDGRKLSGRVREENLGGPKRGGVKGLFRCGTFGDLERRRTEDAVAYVRETPVRGQGGLDKRVFEYSGFVDDGGGGDKKNASEDQDGGSSEGRGCGDGQVELDEEGEIDWIAVGANDARIGELPRRKARHRSGYPPLRTARGRHLSKTKVWTGGEV